MFAVNYNNSDAVRILLEHGARVSAIDAKGWSALNYIREDSPDARKILALLRRYGAK